MLRACCPPLCMAMRSQVSHQCRFAGCVLMLPAPWGCGPLGAFYVRPGRPPRVPKTRLNMRAAAKARRVALQRTREMASVYRQCPIMRRNVMLHLLRRQRIRNPILSNDYIDGVPIVYNADHPMWSQMQDQIVRRLDQSRSSTSSSLPVIHSRSSSSSGSY